jgi:hypothetical protein
MHPILTSLPDFRILTAMETMFQVGFNRRVPVPTGKLFGIHKRWSVS